jgi:adenylate cyclase, class 2
VPKNLELKARVSSPLRTKSILDRIGNPAEVLRQTDTYFNVRTGRLKLREVPGRRGELIYYKRHEKRGPRWSDYEIVKVMEAKRIKETLSRSLGVAAVVKKVRSVYYFKRIARIHFDNVRRLGKFIELEVISKGDSREVKIIHDELVKLLGIRKEEKIATSYSDLIKREGSPRRRKEGKAIWITAPVGGRR